MKKLKLPTTTTVWVSWVHLLPIQMPGSKSAWMDPPTSSPTSGCGSFANVAGTIQGENLSVDPVSGIVKIKEGIQVGNSAPITNATSSLGHPQGHSGEIVNYRYDGSTWYTVPLGKTLYITNIGTTIICRRYCW